MNRSFALLLLALLIAPAMHAGDDAPAPGLGRYRVTLAAQVADDEQAISGVVAICRCPRYPAPKDGRGGFLVDASPAVARVLAGDPRVASLEELSPTSVAPSGSPAVPPVQSSVPTPRVGPDAHSSWSTGTYLYDGSGNIRAIGTDRFTYDAYGRVTSGQALQRKQEYTYDRYGNLATIQTPDAPTPVRDIRVSTATNRLVAGGSIPSVTYDQRGRLTALGADTYAYDSLDTLSESRTDGTHRVYVYTANDERLASIVIAPDGTEGASEWTVRDPAGQVLRRFTKLTPSKWTWDEDYIYRDGQLLAAEVAGPERTLHFHLDHLGSPRLITNHTGATVAEHAYFPFGEEATDALQDREKRKFTGHERDSAALDYMHARYYSPSMGRFLSVDRVISKQTLRRAQMWNRYAYVSNNPLKYVDPTGNEIRLTGCIQDANSQACKDQTSIAQQSFGKAWQYVDNNNGVLTLKAGVSPAMLGARFGASTRALAFMANSKDGFNLITGAVAAAVAKDFGGARTIAGTNGGANIYIDTARFPQSLGSANVGAAEAFVHETGHGIEPYFASIRGINGEYAGSGEVGLRGEAFPVFLENSFRRQTLGLPNNDVRVFYKEGGDIRYPGTHLEDMWP